MSASRAMRSFEVNPTNQTLNLFFLNKNKNFSKMNVKSF